MLACVAPCTQGALAQSTFSFEKHHRPSRRGMLFPDDHARVRRALHPRTSARRLSRRQPLLPPRSGSSSAPGSAHLGFTDTAGLVQAHRRRGTATTSLIVRLVTCVNVAELAKCLVDDISVGIPVARCAVPAFRRKDGLQERDRVLDDEADVLLVEPVVNKPTLGVGELLHVDKTVLACEEHDFEPFFHHKDLSPRRLPEQDVAVVLESCSVRVGEVCSVKEVPVGAQSAGRKAHLRNVTWMCPAWKNAIGARCCP